MSNLDPPRVAVLSADRAGTAERWQVPPLEGWGESAVEESDPPPTAEEIEAIEQTAYEEGLARGLSEGHGKGYDEGYASGVAKVNEQVQRLREVLEHLSQPLADLDAEVERMLVALSIEVGRRLVNQQLQLDPTLTATTVNEALKSLSGTPRELRVHLAPSDVEVLKDVLTPPADMPKWHLIADPELRPGDCRIVTEGAQIDALLDTRQASIARALLGDEQ